MSNLPPNLTFQQQLLAHEKFYRRDALARCNLCNDALPSEPCTQECSKIYHGFKQGERMLLDKYEKCFTKCKDDKCRKICQDQGSKDLASLINLIKRSSQADDNIENLLKKE